MCSVIDINRDIFPSHVGLYVQNDAVAALASGTMGKLHGCVLIAGTGTIAYGFTEDGREARAAGAGPVLGDWGRYSTVALFSISVLSLYLSLSVYIYIFIHTQNAYRYNYLIPFFGERFRTDRVKFYF